MQIKILQRRSRQRHQHQPERVVPAAPPSPPSGVSRSTSSGDDQSLRRRNSAFSSLERQLSGLSLRSSFSKMRRSRSPPPPYTATASPSAVVVQVPEGDSQAAAADASTTAKNTAAAGGEKSDSGVIATINITAAPAADTMTGSSSKAEEAAEELLLDVAAAPFADLPRPSSKEAAAFRRLARPVVVPRLHGGPTVPFARGYAPCLGDTHSIDAATFLAFIDGLNLVTSPHPAALIFSAVAFSMNFVPHDSANAIGAIMQLLADVTTTIVAQQRAKIYLARANATLFEPRGLHVAIAKTKKMRSVLGIAPKAPLLAPLSEETLELATLERCMYHLDHSGWAASLELEVRTGRLLPMAKPTYREADASAGWHPDHTSASASSSLQTPPPMQRSLSTWSKVGRSVNHGLAVVADKRVRYEIGKAQGQAKRARRRAWKRHNKGKKLKEPFGEKWRVGQLSWILVRNLGDVQRERAEAEAKLAAKKAAKAQKRAAKRKGSAFGKKGPLQSVPEADEKADKTEGAGMEDRDKETEKLSSEATTLNITPDNKAGKV